ncbi:MAG: response regulator [Deltaproteobacteria bacterium]|nr:response regulator [Deltaproteobacteria bacterium]
MSAPIRVLIADDSLTVRHALRALLAEERDVQVVGEAADGGEAIALARRLRPDVVTMDVMMPGVDGLRATEEIMAVAPTRIIVISQLAATQQDLAFRALASGALELMAKPATFVAEDLLRWGRAVATAIRLMHEVPVVTRRRTTHGTIAPFDQTGPVHALGVVASTGGPQIIAQILTGLPADLPIPILVAQHIADGFVDGLARWFSQVTPLKVEIARCASRALPAHVYLPPAGHSLVLERDGTLGLRRCPGSLCPSGDATLFSLAASLGARAAGIVLSGMGEDGAQGLAAIRRAGGVTLAQDEASCVVYGIPRAAVAAQAVAHIATPEEMAPFIIRAAARAPIPEEGNE